LFQGPLQQQQRNFLHQWLSSCKHNLLQCNLRLRSTLHRGLIKYTHHLIQHSLRHHYLLYQWMISCLGNLIQHHTHNKVVLTDTYGNESLSTTTS
jgi:sulfur relay (sulfurtransferase) complex TusBCD TusD component (DsrE family)